jgi:hypothetical protein
MAMATARSGFFGFLLCVVAGCRKVPRQGTTAGGASATLPATDDTILVVHAKNSLITPLPRSDLDRIRAIPGVEAVTDLTWMGGSYTLSPKDLEDFATNLATDPGTFFTVYRELALPDAALRAWMADANGCVVSAGLAARYGFKVGDHIDLHESTFADDLHFTVDGIFETPPDWFATTMLVRDDTVYASLPATSVLQGTTGSFAVRCAASNAASVGSAIDAAFATTDSPTSTVDALRQAHP